MSITSFSAGGSRTTVVEASRYARGVDLRLAATVVEREDGGPMRPVGRRRRRRPGGLYYSHKMGRHVGWESKAERDAFFFPEVSPDIVAYREQPHTVTAMIDGVRRSYTPDRLDIGAHDGLTVVEIKDKFEADADPDYALKLEFFADVYAALGWDFSVIDREELEAQASVAALKKIQSHRRVSFDVAELDAVKAVLAGRSATVGELQQLFNHPLKGEAKLCAMMVMRHLRIDLNAPLCAETLVTPV